MTTISCPLLLKTWLSRSIQIWNRAFLRDWCAWVSLQLIWMDKDVPDQGKNEKFRLQSAKIYIFPLQIKNALFLSAFATSTDGDTKILAIYPTSKLGTSTKKQTRVSSLIFSLSMFTTLTVLVKPNQVLISIKIWPRQSIVWLFSCL